MKKKYRLPKKFTEKWLKALRSGEYKQGYEALCEDDRFCCLGVACIVAGNSKTAIEGHGFINRVFGFKSPNELIHTGEDGTLPIVLSVMNDTQKSSFHEIADWIEENIEMY